MNCALIKDAVVKNIILVDEAFYNSSDFAQFIAPQHDATVIIDGLDPMPAIGWGYVDGAFVDPNPPPG